MASMESEAAGTLCPGAVPPQGQEFYLLTPRGVFTKVKMKIVSTGELCQSAVEFWLKLR